jgi:hypothetical protein
MGVKRGGWYEVRGAVSERAAEKAVFLRKFAVLEDWVVIEGDFEHIKVRGPFYWYEFSNLWIDRCVQ